MEYEIVLVYKELAVWRDQQKWSKISLGPIGQLLISKFCLEIFSDHGVYIPKIFFAILEPSPNDLRKI